MKPASLITVLAFVIVLLMLLPGAGVSGANPDSISPVLWEKVDDRLQRRLAAGGPDGTTEFLLRLVAEADLGDAWFLRLGGPRLL